MQTDFIRKTKNKKNLEIHRNEVSISVINPRIDADPKNNLGRQLDKDQVFSSYQKY